jgi:uracil-DNA glycosylase
VTARKSSYRSLTSLARDLSRCRDCLEEGFPLFSLPVRAPLAVPRQRAYLFGQAPGPLEGVERLPWRGSAGQRLREWLQLGEREFYATFYCASVTRCDPGRAPKRGDRTPRKRERELCAPWREWELRLLRPQLIVTVGGLALRNLLGFPKLTPHIGERYSHEGATLIPLPHTSGASDWVNRPGNAERLERALALIREERARL